MRAIWAPKPGATKRAPPGEFIGESCQPGPPFLVPHPSREGHASSCPGSTFALQRHSIRMQGPPCSPSKTQHQLSRPPPRSTPHRFRYIALYGNHIHMNIHSKTRTGRDEARPSRWGRSTVGVMLLSSHKKPSSPSHSPRWGRSMVGMLLSRGRPPQGSESSSHCGRTASTLPTRQVNFT